MLGFGGTIAEKGVRFDEHRSRVNLHIVIV